MTTLTSIPPSSHPATPEPAVVADKRRQRNILLATCTALMAVMASVSGLNVAQQELAIDLGASQNAILWIINGYTVALAALLMPVGAIGDRWGRKHVLLAGLAVFVVASLAAGLATTTAMMIAARVLAGVGAAMIMPVTLSVITSSFADEDRAQAIGVWAGVAGSGGLVGLFAASFMVDVLTWRWLFAIPAVLVLYSAYMTVRHIPNSVEHSEHPFDVVGSLFSMLAIGGLVLGIHEGPEQGWTAPITLGSIAIGIIGSIAFVAWERRHVDPLLDVRVFRNRALSGGAVTLMALFAVMFGIFLVLFPFMQAVIGWSALRSAVALLPMAFVMMPTSAVLSPKVTDRLGTRNAMLLGATTAGIGLMTLALRASVDGGYGSILPGLLIIGLGMGLTMTPATAAITETLPEDKQGVASALNDTTRELGGAIGVALLGSILTTRYESSIDPHLEGIPEQFAEPAREGIGSAFGVASTTPEYGPAIIEAAKDAFVDGWVQSMWIGVGLVAVAIVHLAVNGPRRADAVAPAPVLAD
ncbi:MAG: MFS transporter [Acidimicrobiales bacterium]|nr:MFS transporter [Acidimicrobiales bacterium]